MPTDGYTIGEVLNQLKEEFEDITISKIRFLESEGLIYPDRTESGYRKFTDDDVDRLRFILTAQRDHYLPLKVIREQLERLDAGELPGGEAAAPPGDRASTGGSPPSTEPAAVAPIEVPSAPSNLGLRELCEATGLDAAQVRALRDFGILGGHEEDSAPFDADDVAAGRTAKELLRLGLEPRHLRMYRQFAEREVALFEQLVTPLQRQRNPEARRQAARQLEGLAELTTRLQSVLLSRELRAHVHHHL
ncbi:MAG: MerR family transcriptional regulator [Actinomycetota bacterium]